ncbi:MAG: hypothetical protein D6795_15520 [Deltaproteobacteria bacterium]|nr:MAG: hypothetical protein D6795_15520 [Deltaproteobacteria bacterium]
MTKRRCRRLPESVALLLLAGCITRTIPPAGALESWNGTIREVGSEPARTILLMEPKTKEEWALEGPLLPELRRIVGMRVTLWGKRLEKGPLYPRIEVDRYEIEDVGGANKPEVGWVRKEKGQLLLARENKPPIRLSGEAHDELLTMIGAKIWVIGYQQSGSLRVYRFGLLRAPNETPADWFDFE